MADTKVTLNKVRETKNMVLFETGDTSSPVRNLYVAKSAFKEGIPNSITVTISAS